MNWLLDNPGKVTIILCIVALVLAALIDRGTRRV